MDTIWAQVRRAWRRLLLTQFFRLLCMVLTATLLLGAGGLLIPRLWPLAVSRAVWDMAWLASAVAVGLLVSLLLTWWKAGSRLEAALEIDRRCDLKERISSAVALSLDEQGTAMGRALVEDARRRIERLDVSGAIPVVVPRRGLVLVASSLGVAIFLTQVPLRHERIEGAEKERQAAQAEAVRQQVVTATKKLQAQLQEVQKKAEEGSLPDADFLRQVHRELEQLARRGDLDRKEALLKINDLAQQVEARRQQLGDAEQVRQQLGRLGPLAAGPAEKLAQALKTGDFGKAQEELRELARKLAEGKLAADEQQQLARQLDQLQQQIRQALADREEMQRQLAQEIEKKVAEGKLGEAARLQQQLDQLRQANPQALDRLAHQLAQAARNLAQAGSNQAQSAEDQQAGPSGRQQANQSAGRQAMQQASQQLAGLADSLGRMQQELDAMSRLQAMLDQLADTKLAMSCTQCQGQGCSQCQAPGGTNPSPNNQGSQEQVGQRDYAGGRGRAAGRRGEERTDSSFYDTRVAADPRPGESVRIGEAGGPNQAGRSLESIKAELLSDLARPPDAVDELPLPRDQRENARQFFERLREGR